MRNFRYMEKYSGNEADLLQREHPAGFVSFKEPEDMKRFSLIASGIAFGLIFLVAVIAVFRLKDSGMSFFEFSHSPGTMLGCICSMLILVPHEFLHGICFKEDVYLYQNRKQGLLFVTGLEDMSRSRFVWMSLFPNLVFGFLPFFCFLSIRICISVR